jgi:EAL domain-containing protein (putative c-di-GMP-specific phosphodiesterase class I)
VTGLARSPSPHEAARRLAQDPSALGLVAQPIMDTSTGDVAGYELLARLPDDWRVGPEELFSAAGQAGLSVPLTVHVLGLAVELRDSLPPRTFLTFNCSPDDLVADLVLDAIAQLDLDRIFVEVTELAWPGDGEAVLAAAQVVRDHGGRLAADDVGSGYAGLLQLIRLRPELVKVERAIVQRLGHDVAAGRLVELLGSLADQLDAWVVAEGVEDQAQLSQLIGLGVPLVQGYYLGRPAVPWQGGEHGEQVRHWSGSRDSSQPLLPLQRAPLTGELVLGPGGQVVGVRVLTDQGARQVAPLTLDAATPLRDAALRAMARCTPLERMAPLVLTDAAGHATGVIPVERLVAVLAGEEPPSPSTGRAYRDDAP